MYTRAYTHQSRLTVGGRQQCPLSRDGHIFKMVSAATDLLRPNSLIFFNPICVEVPRLQLIKDVLETLSVLIRRCGHIAHLCEFGHLAAMASKWKQPQLPRSKPPFGPLCLEGI